MKRSADEMCRAPLTSFGRCVNLEVNPHLAHDANGTVEEAESLPQRVRLRTDHDRHKMVTRNAGLLQPNRYLSFAIPLLFQHRPKWRASAAVGLTHLTGIEPS